MKVTELVDGYITKYYGCGSDEVDEGSIDWYVKCCVSAFISKDIELMANIVLFLCMSPAGDLDLYPHMYHEELRQEYIKGLPRSKVTNAENELISIVINGGVKTLLSMCVDPYVKNHNDYNPGNQITYDLEGVLTHAAEKNVEFHQGIINQCSLIKNWFKKIKTTNV